MIEDERGALIAAAQSQRDRKRLAAAQAEIVSLEHRVEQLERAPSRRLLAPARRAAHLVSRVMRPARRTGPGDQPMLGSTSRGSVLVIDHRWPQPDRDSGSIDIFNLMQALRALGFDAILAASEQHIGPQPARDALIAKGVRCLLPSDAASVADYIVHNGFALDLCILCRVFCGGSFLELVQQHCRAARLIFNSIDLNYMREQQRARASGDAKLLGMIDQLREREEFVIRSCDATLVVSDAEAALLARTIPAARIALMPLARPINPPVTPFAHRHGIGFVGSFEHLPNVDAMRVFLADIWPTVRQALPECGLTIAGAAAPADLAAEGVELAGHVPDLRPWLESLRLTVAPLRYGAGAKGKVATSLAAGVPCIVTTVAAEGMTLGHSGVVLADDPAAFAAAIVRVYQDEASWRDLSASGLAYAETTLSLPAWQARLDAALRSIGFE